MKRVLDWDSYYTVYIRYSAIIALLILNLVFFLLPREFIYQAYQLRRETITIAEQLPPELEKLAEPPPVERPKLPVAAESPEEIEAQTIERTEFQEIIKKPTETDIPVVPYWVVEVKPQPISIPKPSYPDLARQAGVEGNVVVKALVDVDGTIIDAEILKSSGNNSLDQAALSAARDSRFSAAKQRDQFVRVWVSIPFKFSLIGGK
ncbi:MAG: TonB family protein [Candidatus Latescibacteria bacterium]|nr:TonB family protein [Candidatus Latescibacterota bacterium]